MIKCTFCSVWGIGPGKPFDNAYIIKNIIKKDDSIVILFDGGEECTIYSPRGISEKDNSVIIADADKIVWKNYYYGRPVAEENLIITEYTKKNKRKGIVKSMGALEGTWEWKCSEYAFEMTAVSEQFRKIMLD